MQTTQDTSQQAMLIEPYDPRDIDLFGMAGMRWFLEEKPCPTSTYRATRIVEEYVRYMQEHYDVQYVINSTDLFNYDLDKPILDIHHLGNSAPLLFRLLIGFEYD
jgi:hypothetical protein